MKSERDMCVYVRVLLLPFRQVLFEQAPDDGWFQTRNDRNVSTLVSDVRCEVRSSFLSNFWFFYSGTRKSFDVIFRRLYH